MTTPTVCSPPFARCSNQSPSGSTTACGRAPTTDIWRRALRFGYATGVAPLDAYQVEFGRVGTPSGVIEDLTHALTGAIEELTRPVDAIKHQAKTVTVGISRSDESLLDVALVAAALSAGAARDRLSYKSLRTLAGLDAVIDEVVGYTRYRIEGDVEDDASIVVVDRGGIARDLPLRTEKSPLPPAVALGSHAVGAGVLPRALRRAQGRGHRDRTHLP